MSIIFLLKLMKSKKITLCLLVILCSFSVAAKMFKCTDSKGNVSYGSSPCKEDKNEKEIKNPYSNEESRQEQAGIVNDRKAASQPDEKAVLQQRLDDATAKGDTISIVNLRQRLHDVTVYGSNTAGRPKNQMDDERARLAQQLDDATARGDTISIVNLRQRLHDVTVATEKSAATGNPNRQRDIEMQEQQDQIDKLTREIRFK
jgi:plastocyanin